MKNPRRPSLLWRTFVIVGMGTTFAVAFNDEAWEKWKGVAGDAVPRDKFKSFAVGTAGLHVAEGFGAYIGAKRARLDNPMKWAFSALLWGFPVHRRLASHRRSLKAAA